MIDAVKLPETLAKEVGRATLRNKPKTDPDKTIIAAFNFYRMVDIKILLGCSYFGKIL